MSSHSPVGARSISRRRCLALALAAALPLGLANLARAQQGSGEGLVEHLQEYWEKVLARLDAAAKSTGDEYHKLKDKAARSTGSAREKLAEEMETLSKKWAIAREKLATSVELHMHSLGDELKSLEEKAAAATNAEREKMHPRLEKLRGQWTAARAKLETTLSANVTSSREEIEHLKQHGSELAGDAKAKLGSRMERLKAEFNKNREKLADYLESDLKKTKEDMDKLGAASTDAAKAAKEKLSKKYRELQAKIQELAKD
jgi:uncharacterized protein YicC (UPF0701 family)